MDKNPHFQEQQGPWPEQVWRWRPRECGGSEQLQEAVHSSNLDKIHIIMEALEKEHESL